MRVQLVPCSELLTPFRSCTICNVLFCSSCVSFRSSSACIQQSTCNSCLSATLMRGAVARFKQRIDSILYRMQVLCNSVRRLSHAVQHRHHFIQSSCAIESSMCGKLNYFALISKELVKMYKRCQQLLTLLRTNASAVSAAEGFLSIEWCHLQASGNASFGRTETLIEQAFDAIAVEDMHCCRRQRLLCLLLLSTTVLCEPAVATVVAS